MKPKPDSVKASRKAAFRRGFLDGIYSPYFILRTNKPDTSKYKVYVSDAWVIVGETLKQVMDEQEAAIGRPEQPAKQRRLERSAG